MAASPPAAPQDLFEEGTGLLPVILRTCPSAPPQTAGRRPCSARSLGLRTSSVINKLARVMPSSKARAPLLAHVSQEAESLTCYRDPSSSAAGHASGRDLEMVLRVPLSLALVAAVGDAAVSIALPSADTLDRLRGTGKARCDAFNALKHEPQRGGAEVWTLECQSPEAALLLLDRLQLAGCILQGLRRRYKLLDVIGEGSFGRVFRAEDMRTGSPVAIKVFLRRSSQDIMHPILEASILRSCCHSNILAFHGIYQVSETEILDLLGIDSPSTYAMVSEYIEGGPMLESLVHGKPATEDHARHLTKQLLSAVSLLQECSVVHRDIKPENILLTSAGDHLKLVDFGLAALETDSEAMRIQSGSPGYVAPEVITGVQTCKSDCFSIGAILFILLTGKSPFPGKDLRKVLLKNLRAQVDMNELMHVSQGARDVVVGLMHRDAQSRVSASEALHFPWFAQPSPTTAPPVVVPSASLAEQGAPPLPSRGAHARAPRRRWHGSARRRSVTPPPEVLACAHGQGPPAREAGCESAPVSRRLRARTLLPEKGPPPAADSCDTPSTAATSAPGPPRGVDVGTSSWPMQRQQVGEERPTVKELSRFTERASEELLTFKERPSFSERASDPNYDASALFIRKVPASETTQLERPERLVLRRGLAQIKVPNRLAPGRVRRPVGLNQHKHLVAPGIDNDGRTQIRLPSGPRPSSLHQHRHLRMPVFENEDGRAP